MKNRKILLITYVKYRYKAGVLKRLIAIILAYVAFSPTSILKTLNMC